MCTLAFSTQWLLFVYMGTAMGIPFLAIIIIYRYIVRQTRRVNVTLASTNLSLTGNRNIRVLKNVLTLVTILGTAGLPNLTLLIWVTVTPGKEPVELYLICVMTVSFCTNAQIIFIFMMNKNVRSVFWKYIPRICHCFVCN